MVSDFIVQLYNGTLKSYIHIDYSKGDVIFFCFYKR